MYHKGMANASHTPRFKVLAQIDCNTIGSSFWTLGDACQFMRDLHNQFNCDTVDLYRWNDILGRYEYRYSTHNS